MLLSGGTFQGRRYLTEGSVREMICNQLSISALNRQFANRFPSDPIGYGLGWFIYGPSRIGHGGAYGTEFRIAFGRGRATVWLVQQPAYPANGSNSQAAFEQAARTINAPG
jgi:CubicO group peptidase (beta-lactamase class C family)